MRRGFTKAALGFIGAAVLSSSAYAMGPTISGLPDVIITDNTKDAGVVDDNGVVSTPQNIYRFTQAFDLASYVSSNDATTVEWQFEELDASMTRLTGTDRTISINGQLGAETMPDYSSITGSGNLVDSTPLDFQNEELTPDVNVQGTAPTGTVDGITNVDETTIMLYVASDDVANAVDFDSFTVFTTNNDAFAEADTLSAPTTAFIPVTCITDFDDWFLNAQSGIGGPAAQLTPSTGLETVVSSADPAVTFQAVPAGTLSLGVETDASTAGTDVLFFQFGSWGNQNPLNQNSTAITATADTLYKIRWTISSDAATTAAGFAASPEIPTLRLRAGEATVLGNGAQSEEFIPNGANSVIGTDVSRVSYYYAKDDYSATGATPKVGLFFDAYDLYNGNNVDLVQTFLYPSGHRDYGATLSSVEIYSINRSELGAGTVLFNQGAASVPVAAGEAAPPSDGQTGFNLSWWYGRAPGNPSRVSGITGGELTGTADALPFTITTGSVSDTFQAVWDPLAFASPDPAIGGQGNLEEVVTVPNDVIVAIDIWMSSPQGSVTPNSLPGRSADGSAVRVLYQTDVYGPTGQDGVVASPPGVGNAFWATPPVNQGRAGYFEFSASNAPNELATPYALETTSKRVSLFFEPQAVEAPASGADALSFRPQVDVYSFPSIPVSLATTIANSTPDTTDEPADFTGALNQGTININRVVVTSYPLTDLAPICP